MAEIARGDGARRQSVSRLPHGGRGLRLRLLLVTLSAAGSAAAAAELEVGAFGLQQLQQQKWAFPVPADTSTAERSFSCHKADELTWSYSEQEWCCLHRGLGCSASAKAATQRLELQQLAALSTTPVFSEAAMARGLFDCVADFANWRRLWSADKAAWCCDRWGRSCSSATSAAPSEERGPRSRPRRRHRLHRHSLHRHSLRRHSLHRHSLHRRSLHRQL